MKIEQELRPENNLKPENDYDFIDDNPLYYERPYVDANINENDLPTTKPQQGWNKSIYNVQQDDAAEKPVYDVLAPSQEDIASPNLVSVEHTNRMLSNPIQGDIIAVHRAESSPDYDYTEVCHVSRKDAWNP